MTDKYAVIDSDGESHDVRGDISSVTVSASVKKQLQQYEPISESVSFEADVPAYLEDAGEFDRWMDSLSELAYDMAEQAVLTRFEEHVRDGDEF